MLAVNLALLPVTHYSKLSILLKPSFYSFTESDRTGWHALKLIPPDASVLAQFSIVPHLSERPVINMMRETTLSKDLGEDYVIASQKVDFWPFEGLEGVGKILEQKLMGPYDVIFNSNGWVVLKKRPGDQNKMEPQGTRSNTE
jgi:hypothetical protein